MAYRLLILLLLMGCVSDGVYRIRDTREYKAVAVDTNTLISVDHPSPRIGQIRWVWIRNNWYKAKIVKVGPYGLIVLKGIKPLDLQPGDSGSPVALIIAREN